MALRRAWFIVKWIVAVAVVALIAWTLFAIITNDARGVCENIWGWCFMSVFVILLALLNGFTDGEREPHQQRSVNFCLGAMTLAYIIWGFVLWGNLSGGCEAIYRRDYPDLWLLYQVQRVLLVVLTVWTGILFLGDLFGIRVFKQYHADKTICRLWPSPPDEEDLPPPPFQKNPLAQV